MKKSKIMAYIVPAILIVIVITFVLCMTVFSNGTYVAHFSTGGMILLPIVSRGTIYAPRGWTGRKLKRYFAVMFKIN